MTPDRVITASAELRDAPKTFADVLDRNPSLVTLIQSYDTSKRLRLPDQHISQIRNRLNAAAEDAGAVMGTWRMGKQRKAKK